MEIETQWHLRSRQTWGDQSNVLAWAASKGHVHGPAAAGICIDACNLSYHQRPSGCLWCRWPLETMWITESCDIMRSKLIQVACAATTDFGNIRAHPTAAGDVSVSGPTAAWICVDVPGLFYHQRPCVCPWSGLRHCAELATPLACAAL